MIWPFGSKPDPKPLTGPTVLLVGHCGFDSGGLTQLAQTACPTADVRRVNDQTTLDQALAEATADKPLLLLVNRVLDGSFNANGGIGLIAALPAASSDSANAHTAALLISNYADSQAEAETNGAKPGFGKSDLGTDRATQCVQQAVADLPGFA